jgi:hypothetical protein
MAYRLPNLFIRRAQKEMNHPIQTASKASALPTRIPMRLPDGLQGRRQAQVLCLTPKTRLEPRLFITGPRASTCPAPAVDRDTASHNPGIPTNSKQLSSGQ